MEFNLILFLLVFVIVVYLIFKFIKKVVFAILSVVLLVVLIVAGIGALVYMDFNSLASQEVFNVKIIQSSGEEYLLGLEVPFDNGEPVIENAKGITNIDSLDVESIDKNSGEFVIVVEEVFFEELIQGKTFSFTDALTLEGFEEYNLTFSDEELLSILNSDNSDDVLIDLIFEKSSIPSFLIESAKPIAKEVVTQYTIEEEITIKEAIFSLGLLEAVQDESNSLLLIQGFKDDQLRVYPDRIVYDLVKLIPAQTIQENIPEGILN